MNLVSQNNSTNSRYVGAYPLIETTEGKQRITVFDVDGRIMEIPSVWLNTAELKDSSLRLQARNICYIANAMHECMIFPKLPFDRKVHLLNRNHVETYVNYEVGRRLEETTVHSREMTLFKLLVFMDESNGSLHRPLKDGPYRDTRKITSGRYGYLPKELTENQMISLLNNLHNECERALVHFIFDTGIRITQVVQLTNVSLPDEVAAAGGHVLMKLAANKQRKTVGESR